MSIAMLRGIGGGGGAPLQPMIEAPWLDVVELRDSGQLTPGTFYRISDYITTTNGVDDTSCAQNPFDVVVLAISGNKVSEQAYAINRAGDEYFADNQLNAWEIEYSLDNDTNRFSWADELNGTGVIYSMKDEFGNKAPYDFKNILFNGMYTFDTVGAGGYDGKPGEDASMSVVYNVHNNVIKPYIKGGIQYLNCNTFRGESFYNNTFDYDCNNNILATDCHDNKFEIGCEYNEVEVSCSGNTFPKYTTYEHIAANTYNTTIGVESEVLDSEFFDSLY